ncbi:hypothetical protein [Poseidonocella sedimentorum]|uniref:Uncharacterized protein n=1 Tax=Poseidonocella sedimentorum TaxID=871652 RepID=A0A1I6CUW0_9RHOB|nr:hypothetical protein [Poseidonocella sedimentorum]SFQ96970.1 hypothetical protein SAMN04515673_101411 [Poseidonocella sedimentorum]
MLHQSSTLPDPPRAASRQQAIGALDNSLNEHSAHGLGATGRSLNGRGVFSKLQPAQPPGQTPGMGKARSQSGTQPSSRKSEKET